MFLPIENFTQNEIEEEIKLLNNKKVPGCDIIDATVVKKIPV